MSIHIIPAHKKDGTLAMIGLLGLAFKRRVGMHNFVCKCSCETLCICMYFFGRHLGAWEFAARKMLFKQLWLERQKMPLCLVGKYFCIIDLHSGMTNVIPPSTLCAQIWKLKTLMLKNKFYFRESTQQNAKVMEIALSQVLIL